MFARAIVREMRGLFSFVFIRRARDKSAFDCDRASFFRGLLGFQNNFENVESMFFGYDRSFAGVKAFDDMTKPVRPWPVRGGLFENLPTTGGVLPNFVAVGIPIVGGHLDRAAAAVNFDGRIPVLLHRETARHGCVTTAEIDYDLRVLFGFHRNAAAINLALRNCHTHERGHAFGGTEQTGKAGDRINSQIKQAAAAWLVKPFRPPRA